MADTPIADVSDTGLWVAAFRARESERADALFHDPLAAVLSGERGKFISQKMPYPKILAWIMAVRTVAIDRLIFEAIAAGVDTVINIGAGLDTRPYRLALPKELHWIEIDFPHVVDMKNAKLSQEQPRCRLSRIGLDVSNRSAAQGLYRELGAQSRQALLITEGVIAYLSNEEAGQLAADLKQVPSFRYWIQDYRKSNPDMQHPNKLDRKLKNAPFRFHHMDPLGFFASLGWLQKSHILAVEEAERLGRPFPLDFPFNYLVKLMPKARREAARQSMGYVLLEAASGRVPS